MASTHAEVVVLGGGISKFARQRFDGTPVDWMVEAAIEALDDAGVEAGDIDHTVVAYESEILARQLSMGQVFQDTLGLCPKPSLRVEAGGGSGGAALRTAFGFLRGGLCESVLIVGADAVGREVLADTVRQVYALSGDVDFEMAAGGSFLTYYALMMREHMQRYGTTEEQMARVSVKNHRNATNNPMACMPMDISVADVMDSPPIVTPYKRLDCSVLADGAAALVLATAAWARERANVWVNRPPVYFTGSGCATERTRLGDRPQPYPGLAHFRAKREAAKSAYTMAGITDPRRELDVAEVADPYSGAELQAYEDLQFCDYGQSGPLTESGVFDLGGALPTNTSGGLIGQGAPPGAAGIAQAVEVLRQLRGECPATRQVDGARRGLTDSHGGTASFCSVAIFARRDEA